MDIYDFGGEESYIYRVEKDKLKKNLCNENNITLIYYTNPILIKRYINIDDDFNYLSNLILSEEELDKYIKRKLSS